MKRFSLTAVLPFVWLAAFFLFPFLLVAKLSLSDVALAIPPYQPRLDLGQGLSGLKTFARGLDLETYARLKTDHLYVAAYLSSLKFAVVSTVILLLVGYPLAYGMARSGAETRRTLMMAVILPFSSPRACSMRPCPAWACRPCPC